MKGSSILTSHAGNLPRPAPPFETYARRARGEAIDEVELASSAEAATHWVVDQQGQSGIHIPSDEEQI